MKIFFALLISFNLYAVEETNLSVIYTELASGVNYQLKSYKGRRGLNIDYMKYGFHTGVNGAIVMAVGRNEAAIKYLELAYDLYQKGFAPIYITSHRGQGYSDRRLKDTDRGYVRHFRYYSDDLKKLTEIAKSENINSKLFLLGHSMGGAIALEYLQRFPNDYTKAILSAPMLKILLDEGERGALWKTALACFIPGAPYCSDYVPDGGPANDNPDFSQSDVTSSKARFDFREYLYKIDQRTRIGSSTIRWVRESILANRKMRKMKNMQKVQIPFLVLKAGKELVVDNTGSDEVCAKSRHCKMIEISGALHNLFMEKDKYRNQALKYTVDFFTLD